MKIDKEFIWKTLSQIGKLEYYIDQLTNFLFDLPRGLCPSMEAELSGLLDRKSLLERVYNESVSLNLIR